MSDLYADAAPLGPPSRALTAFPSTPIGLTPHWEGVAIAWDRDRDGDIDLADDVALWEAVDRYHRGQGYPVVAYNYGIGPAGTILAGRGHAFTNGAHPRGNPANVVTIAVAFLMGPGQTPTPAMRLGWSRLRDRLTRNGAAGPGAWPHFYWTPTACPGPDLDPFTQAWMTVTTTPEGPEDMPTADEVAARTAAFLADPQTNRGTLLDPYARAALADVQTKVDALVNRATGGVDVNDLARRLVVAMDVDALADLIAARVTDAADALTAGELLDALGARLLTDHPAP